MRNNLQWHSATIRAHRDLSPSVREFEIRPEVGVRPWSVGSHLNLRVQVDGRDETRPYSLVGLPDDPGAAEVYRIAVRRAEPGRGGSHYLWSLDTGDELFVGEPNNHFEIGFKAPETLLVAGGIGITPMLGMALLLARRGASLRMLYAARRADELIYLAALRASLGNSLRSFCSDQGERIDLDTEIANLPPGAQMALCGPLSLLDAAREAWARAGRGMADLRFETFGNSGRRDAEPFWVELPRHGLRFEVPTGRTLLDVLEEHGVPTLSDCRRGECGLCAVDIVSVQGAVDHRDVFFSAQQKRGNQRLCACVSRISGGGVVLDSAYRPDVLP
ncbi:MAG: PDR/VanB family oxidoreductase [Rubrivivax sp.]